MGSSQGQPINIGFNLTTDSGPLLDAFKHANDGISDIQKGTDNLNKASKASFVSIAKDVSQTSKEISNASDHTKKLGEHVNTVGKAAENIHVLKKEMNDYIAAANAAGSGTKEWTENLHKAAETKEKINELKAVMGGIAGNEAKQLTQAFGTVAQTGIQTFEGILAAEGLFGKKSEDVEASILKLQELDKLSNLAGEFSELGEKAEQFKVAFQPITNLYTKANDAFKNFAANGDMSFGKLASGAKSFFTNFGTNIKSFVSSGIAGIKSLAAAAAANPFGLILLAITAVIGIMVALKDKIKPIADLFNAIGEVITWVKDKFMQLAEAIGLAASEQEKRAKESIENYSKELDAIKERYDYEIKLAEASGKSAEEAEKRKYKAVTDRIHEQIEALALLRIANGKFTDEEAKQFEEAQKQYREAVAERNISVAKEETDARKKREDEAKKYAEKMKQLRKDLAAALLDLLKKSEQAELSMLSGEAKVRKQEEISQAELDTLRKTILEKGKLVDKNFKFTLEQDKQFGILQEAIYHKTAEDLLKIEIDKSNALAEQHKKETDSDLQFLQLKQKLAQAQIEGAKNDTGLSPEAFEKAKQRVLLQLQAAGIKEQLDLKKKQINDNALVEITAKENEIRALRNKNDEESQIKADNFEKDIENIKRNAGVETQILSQEAQNQADEINKKIAQLDKKEPFNLAKALGLTNDQLAIIQQSLAEVGQMLDQAIDSEIAANDQLIQSSQAKQAQYDSEIQSLQSKLDHEVQAGQKGLANNQDRIKNEIKLLEQQKAQEHQQELKDIENKKRLQKEKLALDSALQASNLFVAATNIYAQATSEGGPIGIPVAVAAIAVMAASFIAQKALALKAINSGNPPPGFFKGKVGIEGPGTETSDSINARLSRGESVITAKGTKQHRSILEAINADNDGLFRSALIEELKGTGIVISSDLAKDLQDKKLSVRENEAKWMFRQDNSGVEKRIDMVEGRLVELIKSNEQMVTVMPNGDRIIKSGSNTRIIRKQ